jgi:hypothetical protein
MRDYEGKVDHNSHARLFPSSLFVRVYDVICCGKRRHSNQQGRLSRRVRDALSERGEIIEAQKTDHPREFARVAANLDEFCGEENFEKARISIDWTNTCLKNFTKDYKLGFCSRNKNYFCAVYPQSEGCLQGP